MNLKDGLEGQLPYLIELGAIEVHRDFRQFHLGGELISLSLFSR